MEQAKQYLEQYQKATSREERTAVLTEYKNFLATLPDDQREQARQFMQAAIRPQIEENMQTLDAMQEKAELLLNQKGKVTYEGREYYFGDWITIADYCRLYDVKPSRVQNWIDREKVPAENIVVIRELNNLKLLKNQRYQLM